MSKFYEIINNYPKYREISSANILNELFSGIENWVLTEKNTYSAYVPSDGKGLWVQVIDNEIEENFARSGVEAIVERYMENSIFSMENMNEFLNAANKRIIESKIRKGRDYSQEFSVLVVIAEKNEMIVGNIGSTKFKIFRENEIYEELSGNKIKLSCQVKCNRIYIRMRVSRILCKDSKKEREEKASSYSLLIK